ncbi:MAG: hypothetical protein Q8O05_04630, partial [Chloroflexota bacterium]|nr:hypothetical protein [Chloroflexota bacterium]
MKKLVLAVLMSLLLIVTSSGATMAAGTGAGSNTDHGLGARNIVAKMTVGVVGDHTLMPDPEDSSNFVIGTISYSGTITDADRNSKDWQKLEGLPITAVEAVRYQYTIVNNSVFLLGGTSNGILTIIGKGSAAAVMTFSSDIFWNQYGQLADSGRWQVQSTTGYLTILKDGIGDWSAAVNPLTFTGTA